MDQAKKRILVVDDEPDAVEFVRTVMEEDGYEVLSAANGDEGIQTARDQKPDLIILDVQMPGKNGFMTFADIRGSDDLSDVPVVMLTAITERTGIPFSGQDMGEYLGNEPQAYVEKPVDPEELSETVHSILEPGSG